jgi:hypothetical protein
MSVRDRLERESRLELEDQINSVRPVNSTTNQGGTGMSTRERPERRASEASPDPVVRLDPHRSTGMGSSTVVSGSVRQRLTVKQEEAEKTHPANAAVEYYYNLDVQRRAKEKADEAQRVRDEQQRRAQQEEARKTLAVDLMIADASPKEIAQVKAIVARNFPADKFSPERHWLVLQELRNAVGIQ